jgi:glyoxylase-like metal-dependent hydrolase (beta-lactamase superfamily II)
MGPQGRGVRPGGGEARGVSEISWVILTLGHLSANPFWGETERRHTPLCTCTVLRTEAGLVLVDPSLPHPQMRELLINQVGIDTQAIAHVFLTHFHGDHRYGLDAFPDATWWMAPAEIEHWSGRGNTLEQRILSRLQPAEGELFPGVRTLALPGHTPGLAGLGFAWRGQRVVAAGDGVMTEQFFWAREGFHNSADMQQARASIDVLAREADIIIPGHGNAFSTALPPEGGGGWAGGPVP